MEIFLVGGAVRDQLLGLEIKDRDWVVVGGTPELMQQQGFRPVGKDFPVFIKPDTGEEYALARTERKSGHGYQGFTFHASPEVTLEQDLQRRDLTINAMAVHPDGTLIDPFGGQQDLQQRKLRHVSAAFAEDPLRVLRVARFMARFAALNFQIAPETLTLMQQISHSGELGHLSAERVWMEFERALATTQPVIFLHCLDQAQALEQLLPDFCELDFSHCQQLLQQLKANDTSAESSFALLCQQALTQEPSVQLNNLCDRVKVPNRFRQRARDLMDWHTRLATLDHSSAKERMALIKALKLIRTPERAAPLLGLSRLLHPPMHKSIDARLFQLLAQLQQVSAEPFILQGLQGKALGKALEDQQQQLAEGF
ncbi:hypothetical protein LH51_10245 [Nitrincola sp. A-D6]|uniref:CCA tRNA nucleotidyltransferase n=1 Tax=Nitrincola sp. A-D6 TaxID=1545442 RepID=UPI00051F877A|nr:CCA tRNA nucleotidyltransferase [Nitrincola sp. A-D6]KGK42066.1 hypothetical protein LH51_10245 [Nitrincola sp. A-D6]